MTKALRQGSNSSCTVQNAAVPFINKLSITQASWTCEHAVCACVRARVCVSHITHDPHYVPRCFSENCFFALQQIRSEWRSCIHSHGPIECVFVHLTSASNCSERSCFHFVLHFMDSCQLQRLPRHMNVAHSVGGCCREKSCRVSPTVKKCSSIMCASPFTISCGSWRVRPGCAARYFPFCLTAVLLCGPGPYFLLPCSFFEALCSITVKSHLMIEPQKATAE